MIWYVNIFLISSIFIQYGSVATQVDNTKLFNLQQLSLDVFNNDFFDINLLKKNDESLRKLTTELSIQLPVDHFNAKDQRKYRMRFFENLKYFKKNGPIIIEMGLEAPSSDQFLSYSVELAKEIGGALYMNEHRYYGKSYPLKINNYKDFDNYKYLSARQSLADVAALLKMLKEDPKYKHSKVVAIGGSYGGNLAAWVRLLYPDLVNAAHASSAPVLAKDEYFEYIEKVNEDFKHYCEDKDFERIKNIFKRYDGMLKTDAGTEQLKKELNICEDVDFHKPYNRHALFKSLIGKFESTAQYGSPSSFLYKCPIIKPDLRSANCVNLTIENVINEMRNSPDSWSYQKCNEFGYFKTLSSQSQIFTHNLQIEFFHAVCKGVFGPEFGEERVKRGVEGINKLFGGKTPNVTKVIFVNGDMDPWSKLSITSDLSPEVPARLLHGTSHCQDVEPPIPVVSAIQEVQEFSKKLIKKWIGL